MIFYNVFEKVNIFIIYNNTMNKKDEYYNLNAVQDNFCEQWLFSRMKGVVTFLNPS